MLPPSHSISVLCKASIGPYDFHLHPSKGIVDVQVHGNLNLSILSESLLGRVFIRPHCGLPAISHDAINTIDTVLVHSEEDGSTYLHRCSFNDQWPF